MRYAANLGQKKARLDYLIKIGLQEKLKHLFSAWQT